MERFWSWLAVELGKRAGLVAAVGLLVTLVLGFGITKLQFATGQDSYLNGDDQVFIDNVDYQGLFGGQAMLVLLTANDGKNIVDVMSSSNQAQMAAAAEKMKADPALVESVITPAVALEWSDKLVQGTDGNPATSVAGKALLAASQSDPTPAGQQVRQAELAKTLQRLTAVPADQRKLDNPVWVDFLLHENDGRIRKALRPVFPDEHHAQMVVRLKGNASIETEGAGSQVVVQNAGEMKLSDTQVTVTGASIILKEINDYLRGGMATLGAIAVVIMVIILLALFHVRWRLLPLGVVLVGCVWAFGTAGYLGIPLSLVTIAGLPVMLGVGIDYAIQMHARVEEEVIIDRSPHPIQETARALCPALLVVTFDAVFAFAALHFAKVPMIRQFGLLLAIGIAVICFASIILPLATLGIREYKSPTKGRDFREGAMGRMTVKLGSLPLWTGPILAVASLAVFAGGILVEGKLQLQTDPIFWVSQDSASIKDFRTVESRTGSSSELGIFVKSTDVFSADNIGFVRTFVNKNLKEHPKELLDATNVIMTVDAVIEQPGAGDVAPTPESVRAAYDLAPPDIQRSTVALDNRAMNVIFRYGKGSLEDRAVILKDVRTTLENPPSGTTATPSGLAVVGVGLLENLEANRVLLTYLAILFVALFLAVRLRSVVRSLLSLVPVLIAVGAASLIAWALQLKLSPMTAVGGPLVVAACTEFTSLILLRFIEERERGLGPRAAVDVAAARTGRAFIVSGLTAVAGVAVIATSSLPLLRDFGIVVALNLAVALISALVVLPPLLVWADNKGWVSKGMIDDDILRATTPKFTGRPEMDLDADGPTPAGSSTGPSTDPSTGPSTGPGKPVGAPARFAES